MQEIKAVNEEAVEFEAQVADEGYKLKQEGVEDTGISAEVPPRNISARVQGGNGRATEQTQER